MPEPHRPPRPDARPTDEPSTDAAGLIASLFLWIVALPNAISAVAHGQASRVGGTLALALAVLIPVGWCRAAARRREEARRRRAAAGAPSRGVYR